ncbi:Protein CHROMATIN REMODELING 19 [Phytophthora fragariae]|uniref:Protein CHROMATIN REMODELING 19 n=1 Tax=Phytophthora fragariae TaxID=53985 RepID=A0A6A3RII9_9STRA|nr:Protein CHROMATIN REMODELING 19 [Phytophthora fragariae]KAE9096425.1 Protein CHROMATIN REMODELING 19 [Phytophthora fragariae]KAE9196676.1 Protein CHROMATIN REMODELING 19 [Phytophthora fragariae]KAE9212360.1 Protein CHROMATIN REMODELING 19 [Phytophthora fragariae]KAE9212902.1 Protein CHROMATIN REMODELING 19 [Phytophthora fragariae]
MALGVKESVSGRLLQLAADGAEQRVCGGKGAVYLSGPKVALRCCGKTSIVATRQTKQSVLRQGDVLLLGLRDAFYVNGTLTKYEVVDTDAAPPKLALNVLPTRVPSITMSSSSRASKASRAGRAAAAPRLVSSFFARKNTTVKTSPSPKKEKKEKKKEEKEEDATASSTAEDAEEEEEEEMAPVKRRRGKRTRAIVESDDEVDTSSKVQDLTVDSDVSSPRDDDIFEKELETSTSAAKDWMAAFGRRAVKKHKGEKSSSSSSSSAVGSDGWRNKREKKEKKEKEKKTEAASSIRRFTYVHGNDDDDSDEDEHYSRSHDEVGQLLEECEEIARKLRRSVRNWSGKATKSAPSSPSTSPADATDEEEAVHMSIASIDGGDRRVVTQADIPDICETLELKPYQVVGVNWLLLLHENKVSGVLADEMGLGKTVQTIAFLLLLKSLENSDKSAAGPHLVVVPASVLNNWKRELSWIAPKLRAVTYHGSKDHRRELEETLDSEDFDILLTTYAYFERDSCQEERAFLRSFQFGYMILDEGHSIKNSNTSRFKRISALRERTRLVLSGTPIQNNLNELLTMLSFLMPRMFDHGSDELLSFFDGNEQKKCEKIRKILAPFILRREKNYVLSQLGPKTVSVELIKVGDEQRKAYTNLLESVVKRRDAKAALKASAKERKKNKGNEHVADRRLRKLVEGYAAPPGSEPSAISIFTQLRKAANHPILLRRHFLSDEVLETMSRCLHRAEAFGNQCSMSRVRQELESYSDFELHDLCVQYGAIDELRQLQLPMETLLASAKFDYLRKLLPKLQSEGHRVLIFSQWTKLLDLLEVLMGQMDYRYLRLDGSTDVQERQGLIDTYNEDKGIFVFLLSTRAGGLGINLTAADTVILHDLDFNPTADEQACDRCHRIGQTKPVSIYKLVSENTVDHDIFKMGESKTELNHKILDKLNAHGDGAKKKGKKLKSKKSEKQNRPGSEQIRVVVLLLSVPSQ